MTDYIVVFVTAAFEKEGEKIAQTLVKEKLAACVNIVPGLKSVFRWKGKINTEEEVLLMIKTKDRLFEKLGNEKYLDWLRKETG